MIQNIRNLNDANRFCVVCGKELGPHQDTHCTDKSVVVITREGALKKRTRYFSLDGTALSEDDLTYLKDVETARVSNRRLEKIAKEREKTTNEKPENAVKESFIPIVRSEKIDENHPLSMQVCPNCSTENNPRAKYCKRCGHSLAAVSTLQGATQSPISSEETTPSTKICPYCNHRNHPDAVYCYFCKRRLIGDDVQKTDMVEQRTARDTGDPICYECNLLSIGQCKVCGNNFCSMHKRGDFCRSCYERERHRLPVGVMFISWGFYLLAGIILFGVLIIIATGISAINTVINALGPFGGPVIGELFHFSSSFTPYLCLAVGIVIALEFGLIKLGKSFSEGSQAAQWIVIAISVVLILLGLSGKWVISIIGVGVLLIIYIERNWFRINQY